MPHRCCVPRGKGNYDNEPKVDTFGFPKDLELKKKWILATKRNDFTPSNHSRVCELHFQSDLIQRKTTYTIESTGETLEAHLKIPRLVEGAISSKLPGCPFLNKDDVPLRGSPDTKRRKIECQELERTIVESLDEAVTYNQTIYFTSLHEAVAKINELEDGWLQGKGSRNLCFFFI